MSPRLSRSLGQAQRVAKRQIEKLHLYAAATSDSSDAVSLLARRRFPVWLQVLIPTRADDGAEDSWESRIRTLKVAIYNSEVKQLHKLKNVENRVANISNELLVSSEDIKNDVKYDNAELKQGMQNMKGDVTLLRKSHLTQRTGFSLLGGKVAALASDVKVMKNDMAEIKALLLMLTNNTMPDPDTVMRLQEESESKRRGDAPPDAFSLDDQLLQTAVIKTKPNQAGIASTMRLSSFGLIKSRVHKKKRKKGKSKGKMAAAMAAMAFTTTTRPKEP